MDKLVVSAKVGRIMESYAVFEMGRGLNGSVYLFVFLRETLCVLRGKKFNHKVAQSKTQRITKLLQKFCLPFFCFLDQCQILLR